MQNFTNGIGIICTFNITKFYNVFTYHPMNINVR